MPPKRKSDAQAETAKGQKNKRQAAEPESEHESAAEESSEVSGEDVSKRDPYEYYCINRHFFDVENENADKDEDDQLDEDELEEHYDEILKDSNVALKPVAEFPDHKWVALWETWTLICDYRRLATYTNPDMFGMHIYNDFNGYGIQELVENLLTSLDTEFKKKDKDEQSWKKMWATSAGMAHWLVVEQMGSWMMLEDGERLVQTIGLIGRSFLTTLSELDRVQQLGNDTFIKDLGLVMSIYLSWADGLDDCGIEEDNLDWRKEIVAYAKQANIDLVAAGCYGVKSILEALEDEHDTIEPLARSKKADRWDWKKAFTAYAKSHGSCGKIGGDKFNILKFSRKQRAMHAFDKKDPLAQFPEKDLREGNIMLA